MYVFPRSSIVTVFGFAFDDCLPLHLFTPCTCSPPCTAFYLLALRLLFVDSLVGHGLSRLCFCSPFAFLMCCIALGHGVPGGETPKHEILGAALCFCFLMAPLFSVSPAISTINIFTTNMLATLLVLFILLLVLLALSTCAARSLLFVS